MKKYTLFIIRFLFFLICINSHAQGKNPYGLKITSETKEYQRLIQKDGNQQLIDIQKAVPGIVLDIRYATTNNFTGQAVYPQARAFARKPVVMQLKAIQEELKSQHIGLKIFDAYRPYAVTLRFFEVYPDSTFVANPKKGSRHNRGAAIDLTLIDLKTGKELEMPSKYDEFTERAIPGYQGASPIEKKNRKLLTDIMTRHGFTIYSSEWWHYDFNGWQQFGLMDLSFEQLDQLDKKKSNSLSKGIF